MAKGKALMTLARTAALAVVLAAAAAAACTPIVRRHGYVPEELPLSAIQPTVDTRSSVLERYGNPSTSAVFDENTWYYITNVREQLGYLQPESSARSIVAVHFDDFGRVAEVETFSLADARNPSIVGRKTPTRGRELTILEQLLGNVGRLPNERISDQDNLPGGAGGPRRD
jgi:outer membrane protein assembly factor BamE (lipoprotein component of BamABCDE complex)